MARDQRTDLRIVYGARCSWWDSIDKVATTTGLPGGLPVCPHCGSPLFEVGSETEWWAGVDQHESEREPGYRAFIEWLRGKCFPTLEAARAAYREEGRTDG